MVVIMGYSRPQSSQDSGFVSLKFLQIAANLDPAEYG